MVLYEQLLVNELHKLANSAKVRIWIASPYIGGYQSVSRILGKKWHTPSSIGVRLITDLEECSKLSFDTLQSFLKLGSIKHLRGLHAKIYIVDDSVIVTSANLTEAAFVKRYEMGVLLKGDDAKLVIDRFSHWWDGIDPAVSLDAITKLGSKCARGEPDSTSSNTRLKNRWKLPGDGGAKIEIAFPSSAGPKLGGYEYFVECYKDLAKIYSEYQRLDPKLPLYFEIDGLLDYLFHHGKEPARAYSRIPNSTILKPRSWIDRKVEIHRCAKEFRRWVEDDENDIAWRMQRSRLIRGKLNPGKIFSANWNDIRLVVDSLNCLNRYGFNKKRVLNADNNSLDHIRKNLNFLLHGKQDIKIRMATCKRAISGFGDSAVQELVGFYAPQMYPIRNGNSNAGMRYFGYDVSV